MSDTKQLHAGAWDAEIGYPAGSLVSRNGKNYVAIVFARGTVGEYDGAKVPHDEPGTNKKVWKEVS